LVGKFKPDTAAFHPAAQRGNGFVRFSGDHGHEYKPRAVPRNVLRRAV
jgi:hypothetical protein